MKVVEVTEGGLIDQEGRKFRRIAVFLRWVTAML
jgi:hypothetical protein